MPRLLLSLAPVALAVLAACSTPPTEPPSLPATPAAFQESDGRWADAPPADAQPRGQWWLAFGDPVLGDLITRADAGNTSLQQAAARLTQARALLRSAQADRAVQVDAGAGAVRQVLPGDRRAATTTLSAGASLSYELDLFGRLARASDAAALDVQAREALVQSTRLLVQANVAQAYFTLRALDAERNLLRDTVLAYQDSLRLVERRQAAGEVAELDVARLRTEAATTESQALTLDRRRAETAHALALLVGESASTFALPHGDWTGVPPIVPAGVPSTVLTRRPDVSAAQRALLASQARLGVAQRAWFPSIQLTAAAGYASPDLGDLFKWTLRTWGVGALLSLPLLDGGRRDAAVLSAQGRLDEAAAGYREQVLVAFKDVEDQLAALRILGTQAQVQQQAVDAASRATALLDARYRNGYVSQLELLDGRRSELGSRRQALQVRADQYLATVGLIRAIGGDWQARTPNLALAPSR